MSDHTDLVARLRGRTHLVSNSYHEWDCRDAVRVIESQAKEIERLRELCDLKQNLTEEVARLGRTEKYERGRAEAAEAGVEVLRDKLCGVETCGCSYDKPEDICACHSPMMRKAQAEVARLRGALREIADHNSHGFTLQTEIARLLMEE
jgi:hypothetical protein